MIGLFKKYVFYIILLLSALIFHSCKTDEFKFNEITIKEDFGVRIITPVFSGKDKQGHALEFRDFIHDWKKTYFTYPSDSLTVLKYSDGNYKTIPTRLIFDPSVIIDSLEFLIQGYYGLKDAELIFIVTNGCPFPLNLELQFINLTANIVGPPINPSPFPEADFSKIPAEPFNVKYAVPLDSLQTQSFLNSKKLRLTAWYNQTNFINQNDTISAHYPIDLSIVLIGTVQIKNEEDTP